MRPACPTFVPGEYRLSGEFLWPFVLCQTGSDFPVLRCPGTPAPDRASPSPYSTEGSHRQAEGGDRPARACAATLQGSHSIATAELPAPPQDTVRRMLKRGPPGRSGQPWRSSREQPGGGKAPGMGEEGLVFSPEPFLLDPSIPNLENLPTQGEGSARPILNPTSLQPPLLCLAPFCFHCGP